MKNSSKLLISAAAVTLGLASVTLSAIANPNHAQKPGASNEVNHGQMGQGGNHGMMGGNMMQMMQRMHGGKGGMMGGGMAGGAMMGNHMGNNMQAFDANDDGTVTPEELRNGLLAELKKYDTDGDGTLSVAEFETLHSARIRSNMVDRFQALDEDGDGKVTEAEISARADKMEKRMRNHASATQMNQMHGSAPESN